MVSFPLLVYRPSLRFALGRSWVCWIRGPHQRNADIWVGFWFGLGRFGAGSSALDTHGQNICPLEKGLHSSVGKSYGFKSNRGCIYEGESGPLELRAEQWCHIHFGGISSMPPPNDGSPVRPALSGESYHHSAADRPTGRDRYRDPVKFALFRG